MSLSKQARDSLKLAAVLAKQFKKASKDFNFYHKQGSFYRCASMYTDEQWRYVNKYFQHMIKQNRSMNPKVVDVIIIGMPELNKDNSFSDNGLMPGLQERVRKDSSSNDNTDPYGDDGIYKNREPWGCKALALKQIINGTSKGIFPNNIPTLYAFSWHKNAKICVNPVIEKNRIFIRPWNKFIFPPA